MANYAWLDKILNILFQSHLPLQCLTQISHSMPQAGTCIIISQH